MPKLTKIQNYWASLFFVALVLGFVGPRSAAWAGGGSGTVKKSLKLVKQGNLQEALVLFQKAKKKKEDDFGLDYVYSLYFLSPYQKTLKLDSSYMFCLSAIQKFQAVSPLEKNKYAPLGIDSAELYSRRDYLDSLGFSQAQRLESEAAYQYFLERFPQSRLAETAKQKRASLAFQRAKSENSYDAFMAFLDKYPDAEQARSAKEISDLLVFENTAKKGKISDWEAFIERNPNNPYVLKALNRLYELHTVEHKPSVYFDFVRKYPENPNITRAWEWIFFLDKSLTSLADMSERYPGFIIPRFESRFGLKNEHLLPFVERGKYGLMQGNGSVFLKPIFDSIPEEYRCEMIWAGFIKAFRKKKVSIFSLDSLPISEGEYDDAEWFSDGMIKTFRNGKQGLLTMFGIAVLGPRYENITRLTNNLLSIQQGNKYYLFTMKGQKLDLPALDEVIPAGKYLVVKLGDKYALLEEMDALQSLQNDPVDLNFVFDKILKLADKKILLFSGNIVNLLINNKVHLLKAKPNYRFEDCAWGILAGHNHSVALVDSNGTGLPISTESLQIFGNMAIARSAGKFGLLNRQGQQVVEFGYDTIYPLLRKSFLAKKGNKRFVLFENGKAIYYSSQKTPEILTLKTAKGIFATYFISLTDSLDRKGLLNSSGKSVLPFAYENIYLLDQHLLAIQADKKIGVADTLGKILIKPSLSGASPLNKEYICVAKGKHFSIVNPFTNRTIPTVLSATAKPYGPSKWFFIVRINDKAGLMDGGGKMVIQPQYEDIMYFNPTRCLVKKDNFWYFYQVESGKQLVKAMKRIRVLLEREGETIYEVESDKKVGLESSLKGEIAPTDNDEIIPFEAAGKVYFFAGRRVQQSSVYNLSYIDQNGHLLKTQLLTEDEYDKIVCD